MKKKAINVLVMLVLTAMALTACSDAGRTGVDPAETGSAGVTASPAPTPEPTVSRTPGPGESVLENGVFYVTAAEEAEAGGFEFKKDFSMELVDYTNKNFNRIIFKYSSTRPLKATVTYTGGGQTVVDTYYLEAGENVTFKGLVKDCIDGFVADSIVSVALDSLKSSTSFTPAEISTDKIDINVTGDTYYVENARYKVGVRLGWGGGINYIEDKTCPVKDLSNLVNGHDTGRLIQQSYYGGYNSSYKPGTFNGQTWTYNPVQGGDQYGNSSRLIDLEIGDNYVYIKSQPQDWAQNGLITPSYMENVYTLADDHIRVDNRFVDFSGYPHGYSHQELPAFYTVSYLDCFSWYNGVDSWTDAALSSRTSLNFWGDAKYADDCRFYMKGDNTETWCAWTNRDADYGIGLFTPGIDQLYAGRYKYNGSKKSSNDATNYVAPLVTLKLPSYTALEYSYMIATGSLSDIRATFKANKDFSANETLLKNKQSARVKFIDYAYLDLSVRNNTSAVKAANNAKASFNSANKVLMLKASGDDPQVTVNYGDSAVPVNTANYSTLTFEYMLPADANSRKDYVCNLFFVCDGMAAASDKLRLRVELTCDSEYHTASVDLKALKDWSGDLLSLRFDFFDACAAGDVMYLKNIKLS